MTDFADRLVSQLECRLPLVVDSDGAEDDWNVLGPALLAAATRQLRAISHIQATVSSSIIGWQLVRSMYEYLVTYAWIAASPETHSRLWLKEDYQQRIKLDDDLAGLEEPLLNPEQRGRIQAYIADTGGSMSGVLHRATAVDSRWADAFREIQAHVPERLRRFRLLYPLIYRNGSRFTHPTTRGVDAFVSGPPPHLSIGVERALGHDLNVIATGILGLGLAVAVTATPSLELTYENIVIALSNRR